MRLPARAMYVKRRFVIFGVLGIATIAFTVRTKAETWKNTGSSWNTASSWNPASVPNGIGAVALFNSAATASNSAQTFQNVGFAAGTTTIGELTINNNAVSPNSYIFSGTAGANLIFDDVGDGPARVTINGITGATGNNDFMTFPPLTVTFNDTLLLTVNNTNTTDVRGAFHLRSAVNGVGGFQKWGAGMATFSTGPKLYQGATVINGGRMCITQLGQPSQTSSLTVNAGGQLTLIANGNFAMGPGPLILNGAGPTTVPYAGFPGAIRNDPGLTVVISNSVVLQSETLLHVQAAAGSGSSLNPTGSIAFAGTVSGTGHLSITAPNSSIDAGSVIFLAHNSYSGGTTINGGLAVARGSEATFGTGDITVDNVASPTSIARLVIETNVQNAIADTSTLSLAGGGIVGVADQSYVELSNGINEIVGRLKLAGVVQAPGTYGSSASPATFKNDEFFSGSGIITVPGPMLNISILGTTVVLSWPTNAGNFLLQSADVPTGIWTNDSSPVEISGVDNTVNESTAEAQKIYRLKNQ